MTQTYHTSGNAEIAAGESLLEAGTKTKNGFDTMGTRWAGTGDPSSGASPAWDSGDVGRIWIDTTDAQNPVTKQWQQTATSGPTYGWRTLRTPKLHLLTTPQSITLATATPATSDVTWTDHDFTTTLDSVQDNDDCLVKAVILQIQLRETGTIRTSASGTTSAYGGIQWREKGATCVQEICPQVASVPVSDTLIVPIDSSEIAQYQLTPGSASPSLAYVINLIGYIELI